MSKLSDKLKNLFSKNRGAPKGANYPAKFEQTAFKAGQKTKNLMKGLSLTKKLDKPASASKALVTASAAKKLRTASKIAKVGRAITPVGLGLTAANLVYDVATMSPEKKAKVKKLKTKLSKKSTKDYHADLLKMSTGGDTMLKGGQKKLDKNKDGKISGEDFKMMKARVGKSIESPGSKANKLKLAKQEERKEKLKELRAKRVGPAKEMKEMNKLSIGAEAKGYGAARTSGMGLQDENLIPGKSLDYYKDIM